jgi:hypothetical protein
MPGYDSATQTKPGVTEIYIYMISCNREHEQDHHLYEPIKELFN